MFEFLNSISLFKTKWDDIALVNSYSIVLCLFVLQQFKCIKSAGHISTQKWRKGEGGGHGKTICAICSSHIQMF